MCFDGIAFRLMGLLCGVGRQQSTTDAESEIRIASSEIGHHGRVA
jgi:hypothetical protein